MVSMPLPLPDALDEIRKLLLDDDLVRAVGAGRRRGEHPPLTRVELRPVDLKDGRCLQVVERTQTTATTRNVEPGAAAEAVDALLALPFGNWHVESAASVVQLRVTKRGEALMHRTATSRREVAPRGHDRVKERLLDADDPLFDVLGADADKRRQVDAFLRLLAPTLKRAASAGVLRDGPLSVVDLGCGNAYLTFGAHRYLGRLAPGTRTTGVELRADLVAASSDRAARAGLEGLTFTPGAIAAASVAGALPDEQVDVVLALHACDTATDEALARAVRWKATVVLAAPCCHHDVQRQLDAARATAGVPEPYGAIVRHPILRERFADVLTDALRASLLRMLGYRTDVVEFVDSRHTPRNAMIRAVRTGAAPSAAAVAEYRELTRAWSVTPALATMLGPELAAVR